jgi:hypothetical protein
MRISLLLIPTAFVCALAPSVPEGDVSSGSIADKARHTVLAADASKRRIAIFDADGKIIWEAKTRSIHDLHYLPNGNILFQSSWTKLVEVTPKNETVWTYDSKTQNGNKGKRVEVHAFQRLADGITMIAESGPSRIIEVDAKGKLLRNIKLKVKKSSPHRDTRLVRKLQNGHYLVAHEGDGFVREYDTDGKVTWEYAVPLFDRKRKGGHGLEAWGNQVFAAIRLPNGNTLISTGNGHAVLEVTKEKKIVWHLKQNDLPGIRLAWVTTLEMLPNGNFVIGNCHAGPQYPQIIEITREKKVVWTFKNFDKMGNSLSNSTLIDPQKDVAFFNDKVEPILRKNCYKCHGTRDKKIRGQLWLRSRRNVLQGGKSGTIVDLASPEASRILRFIKHEDSDHQMPPKKKLAAADIAILTEWVHRGVPMPVIESEWLYKKPSMFTEKAKSHWAFQPLTKAAPPVTLDPTWCRNDIDRFVLARLGSANLKPNPATGRISFIRRATYDLTGLPPTTEAIAAFQADDSENAHEKLIDRLLASPQYGEQWARHWLDLVRYAETNGYERDSKKPEAWRYRQYVIDSFNANKPYDRFVKEQLAGDELPDRTPESITATGYLRLGLWDDEPADRKQALFDGLDDIVRTTGDVFLGLTVGCARCHDHKLDPIPQKDYYGMLAFFHNVRPYSRSKGHILTDISTDEQKAEAERQNELREVEKKKLNARRTALRAEFSKLWAKEQGSNPQSSDMVDVTFEFFRSSWQKLPDFDMLKPETTGKVPSNFFDIGLATRGDSFGFVFRSKLNVPKTGNYKFFLDADDGVRLSIDGKQVILYDGIHGLGSVKIKQLRLTSGQHNVRIDYFQGSGGKGLLLHWEGSGFRGRKRLSTGDDPSRQFERLIKRRGREILGRANFDELQQTERNIHKLKNVDTKKYALSITEHGTTAPETHVLARGSAHAPGAKVEPSFLQILTDDKPTIEKREKTTGRRLAFANWLVSSNHRTTSRVMVNRIWQFHFGRGIVRTSSDLGMTGRKPTHPKLLDWLAYTFVESGWDMKKLHKTIMMSATYRMSSQPNASARAQDPTNDLFWRFDMRRLTAEELRDSILEISGRLDLGTFGGPSVFPTIPATVLKGQSANKWRVNKSLEHNNRRTVYTFVMRSLVDPFVETFDAATTDTSCAVRFQTTQPTQALTMLNSGFVNDAAKLLAERLKKEVGTDAKKQIARALELATGRKPSAEQIQKGIEFLDSFPAPSDPNQALEQFCLIALNLNAFVFVE